IDPEGVTHHYSPYTSVVQYDVNDWTVQWGVDGSQRIVHYDGNVKNISLTGGGGGDNFDVTGVAPNTTLSISERGGDNHLYVGYYDADPRLNDSNPISDYILGNINYL